MQKQQEAEQFGRRHEEVKAEAEAAEQQLEDTVQAMLGAPHAQKVVLPLRV